MKAIMLAAGEGTRCRPFTYLSPKIAQQVCGLPLLEYMLSWFEGTPEIDRLYIAVRNESIVKALEDYLEKRSSYLPQIRELFHQLGFAVEHASRRLELEVIQARGWGTGGDLRLTINQLSNNELEEDFLVCNADYVTVRRLPSGNLSPQLDLSDIIRYHAESKKALNTVMTVALVSVKREEATRFGVAQLEQVGKFSLVRGFVEKPKPDDVPQKPWINAGVYVINGGFLLSHLDDFLPEQPRTNLEKTLLEQLAREKQSRLAAYLLNLAAWFDVGTLEQLVGANIYIASLKGDE